jgi:hypothetical protein
VAPVPVPVEAPLPTVDPVAAPLIVVPDPAPVPLGVPVPPPALPVVSPISPLELPDVTETTVIPPVGEPQATNMAAASEIQGVIASRRDRVIMMGVPPLDAARQQIGVSRPQPCFRNAA